jgi:tetratricopeptide (TPR) repeat protein
MSLWRDSAAKSPDMIRPFVHLGNAYRQAGDFHAASSAYRRALAIDSTHRATNTNLANLHLESGLDEADSTAAAAHFVAAVNGYRAVLEVDSTYRDALGNLAIASMKLGRAEEAELVYLEVVRHHPHFADGYHNLGLLYMTLGRFDAAAAASGRPSDLSHCRTRITSAAKPESGRGG